MGAVTAPKWSGNGKDTSTLYEKNLYAWKSIYVKKKKRIYVHMHINTQDWEISGVIHKKLIAVVASVKSGRWVVRGGVLDSI